MATLDDVRKSRSWAASMGDAELIQTLADYQKLPVAKVADAFGYGNDGGLTSQRIGGAVDNYQGNLYGVAEAVTGADWAKRGRQENETDAAVQSDRARDLGGIDSYKDVGTRNGYIRDGANYIGGLAAQSLPYAGEAIVGGLTGGMSAVAGTGARMGLSRAAMQTAGAVAASYPSAVGDILGNQREQNGSTNLLAAAGLGVPYAALNAFGVEGALARRTGFRSAGKMLDDAAGLRGGALRTATTVGRTGLVEGSTEIGQEGLNQLGRMAVDPNETFFNDKSIDRFGESFVGGAALGGTFGGAAGGWRRSEGYKPPGQTEPAQDQAAALEQNGTADLLSTYGPSDGPLYGAQEPAQPQAPAGPMPGQSDLFSPNGEPTYGAEQAQDRSATQLPFIADSNGAIATGFDDRQAFQDPGTELARQRYQEQQAAQRETQIKLEQQQAAVKEETARVQAVKERAVGFGLKGTKAVEAFGTVEQLRDTGQISEDEFVGYVNDIAQGKAAKVMKTLEQQANEPTQQAAAEVQPTPVAPTPAPAVDKPAAPAPVNPTAAPASPAPATQPAAAPVVRETGAVQPTTPTTPVADDAGAVPALKIGTLRGKGSDAKQTGTFGGKTFTVKKMHWDRLRAVLNLDEDGNQVGPPRSYEDAAEALGLTGKDRRSTVAKSVEVFGLKQADINRIAGTADNMQSQVAENTDESVDRPLSQDRDTSEDSTPDMADDVDIRAVAGASEDGNMGVRTEPSLARAAGGSPIINQDNYKQVVGSAANPDGLDAKTARVQADTTLKNDAKVTRKARDDYDPATDAARAGNEARVEASSKARMDMLRARFAARYGEIASDYDSIKSDKAPAFRDISNNAQERFVLGSEELKQEGKLDETSQRALQRDIERTEEARYVDTRNVASRTVSEKTQGSGRPESRRPGATEAQAARVLKPGTEAQASKYEALLKKYDAFISCMR